ncbi:hypothetical protein NK8_82990 (plasmid) [Caballeronia sp. NK8]|nr:hypothetical protein NK8_82990 [Caballeronia sp. NK8]
MSLIRAGLVAVLAVFCFRVFVPFLDLMVWALILAVHACTRFRSGSAARLAARTV